MSQNIISQQLRHTDPKKRFQAVKEAARSKDYSLLDLLKDMAASDPDEQVRRVAAKAQAYIANGGEEAALPPAEENVRPLSQRGTDEEERAKTYINTALSCHLNGQRSKAIKAMGKALQVSPSIRADAYFVSVLEDVTGLEGQAAFDTLHDEAHIKQVRVNEKQLEREKRRGSHMTEVEKITWVSAFMDLSIYTLITVIGTALFLVIIGQSADGVFTGYQNAMNEYYAGERAAMPERDFELEMLAQPYRELGITHGLIFGLVGGIGGLLSMVVQLGVTHVAARHLFKGDGSLPYLIYRVVSLYNTRLPVIFLLMYVFIALSFSPDMGAIPLLVLGIISLINLSLSFSVISRVGEAYNFGFLRGCLSIILGGIILSVLAFVVQLLLLSALMALLPPGMLS